MATLLRVYHTFLITTFYTPEGHFISNRAGNAGQISRDDKLSQTVGTVDALLRYSVVECTSRSSVRC